MRADNPEPNEPKFGWQQKDGRSTRNSARRLVHLPRHVSQSLNVDDQPQRTTKIDPQLFRVVLRRRRGLLLPLSSRTCRSGRQLTAQRVPRQGFWEEGVSTRVRCMQRRRMFSCGTWTCEHNTFEWTTIGDRLTLWHGHSSQSTTMVSPVCRDGIARPGGSRA